jgi:hypothetical protein
MQTTPAAMPDRAPQAGEATPNPAPGTPSEEMRRHSRWAWAEASIGTDRMLAALENGVKEDVWFRLIDKVWFPRNLWSAWAKVAGNQGAAGTCKTVFPSLDGWIRRRLRSLLRKRHQKRGRGRGRDHQRWPNTYFAALGLYSLTEAHGRACPSVKAAH